MKDVNRPGIGLYIHVPFCKAKCHYCDFNSYAGRNDIVPAYFDALKKEIMLYTKMLEPYKIKTLFIGGGTPSSVDRRFIYEIMNECRNSFNFEKNAEITIEANPGTLSYESLTAYRVSGINRLSMGLQAFQNKLLKKLGRIHDVDEFVANYHEARKAGFKNMSVDLIFGIPGQSIREWEESVERIIALNLEHISCYSMKIEEGTVFGDRYETGELIPVEDELDREMYHYTVETLKNAGYKHYEISNFAKPGFESVHNSIYWKVEEYIGMGAGAHSYFAGERFNNICTLEDYITSLANGNIPSENHQYINKEDSMGEYMLLGLRFIDGVSIRDFKSRYGVELDDKYRENIKRLQEQKLLTVEGDRIRLTDLGLDLANQVFMEFV